MRQVIATLLLVGLSLIDLSFSQTYITATSCTSNGGVIFQNNCYLVNKTTVTWSAGRTYCQSLGGDLASVFSAAENNVVVNIINSTSAGATWMGLWSSNWTSWYYSDFPSFEAFRAYAAGNTSATWGFYSNWNTGEPNNSGGVERCGHYNGNFQWNDANCANLYYSVCKISVGPKTRQSCTSLNGTIYSNSCYFPTAGYMSWVNAEIWCRQSGGRLATISSAAENAAVASMSYPPVGSYQWLGGTDQGNESSWVWFDNPTVVFSIGSTAVNGAYNNWGPTLDNYQGNQNCLALITPGSGYAGLWDDNFCGSSYASLCESLVDLTPPTVTCPSNVIVYYPSTTVTWSAVTATDNSGAVSNPVLISYPTAGLTNGSSFPTGPTVLTYYYNDSSNNIGSCSFTATVTSNCATVPPYFDTTASSTNGGNLTISISASTGYSSFVAKFVGGSSAGYCASDNSSSWWGLTSVSGCFQRLTITNSLNTMIGNCNFIPDESNSTQTVYRAIIAITTTQATGTIRGAAITTTTSTSVAIGVAFNTAVSATTGTLQISGSLSVFGAIISQTFDPLTSTATLRLVTSAPYPFQLWAGRVNTQSSFITSIAPVTAEASISTASVCNTTGIDSWQTGSTCTQLWTFTLAPSQSCPTQTNLNYNGWNVTFFARCHAAYTGACVNSNSSNATLMFSTSSDNYCPQFITNTASASASLSTFSDATFTTPQTQFVFGSRTYYSMVITSPIQIANAHFERISITSGGASGVSNLYLKTFTTPSAFFAATGVFQNQTGSTTLFSGGSTLMVVNDANGAVSYTKNPSFNLVWNSAVSGATGDNALSLTIQAAVRIRFANVTTVGSKLVEFTFSANGQGKQRVLEDDTQIASSAQVSIARSSTVAPPSTTTSSDSVLGTGMSVTIFAGLVAAVGALVIAVVFLGVIISKRRSNKYTTTSDTANVESVQLSSI